jgi:rhodanese-related sulfurtransferase
LHALTEAGSEPPSPDPDEGRCTLGRLVEDAAARITRLSAPDAFAASAGGGIIIDIRSRDARVRDGVVPGSVHIPRTVLEWRIALDSPWRNRHLDGLDQRLILICDHGYSSVLAASNLVALGFHRAGDVVGGFASWQDHGLPVAPCRDRWSTDDALPGTGPPD